MTTPALFSSCLPGWSAQRVLSAAHALGTTSIEWGSGPGDAITDPGEGARIAELCARAGVTSIGLSVQDPEIRLTAPWRRLRGQLELAQTLGARQLRVLAEPFSGGAIPEARRRHRRALDRLVKPASQAGIKILIETSPGTLAPGPELALALVGHQPPSVAGVLYDPGNMIIEGDLAPALAISLLGRHLAHVHVKNIVWSRSAGRWRWRYATLATGRVRWREVALRLRDASYRGRYSIDHLPGAPSVMTLRRETDALARMLAGWDGP